VTDKLHPVILKRVWLLCDAPGLWWASQRFKDGKLDYSKLRREVGNGRQVVNAMVWLHDKDNLDRFVTYLQHARYQTRRVDRGSPIDQLITTTALESIDQFDVLAIAASSGHYHDLSERLKAEGKELEIWAFPVQCVLEEMQGRATRWNQLGEQVLAG
jgi:hypothetical protein